MCEKEDGNRRRVMMTWSQAVLFCRPAFGLACTVCSCFWYSSLLFCRLPLLPVEGEKEGKRRICPELPVRDVHWTAI